MTDLETQISILNKSEQFITKHLSLESFLKHLYHTEKEIRNSLKTLDN